MAKIFGKKQDGSNQDAAVSSIPVPQSDSALVIDLPEGQKLVIGKMEEGTVIEVATWRGTGRPDSRTNRLMLGVSFGGTQAPESTKQEDELDLQNLPAYRRYLFLARKFLSNGKNSFSQGLERLKPLASNFKDDLKRRRSIDNDGKVRELITSAPTEKDFDIDKWLDSVRSNSRVNKLAEGVAAHGGSSSRSGRSAASKSRKPAPRRRTSTAKRPTSQKKTR